MTEIGLIHHATMRGGDKTTWLKVQTYPDGSPRIDFLDESTDYRGIILRPKSVLDLMTGLFVADALRWRGCELFDLILPFVPAARQDRLNNSGDYLFTLKSVANEVNARKFERVVMLDPHSMVAPALIENSRVVNIPDILKPDLTKPESRLWDGWDGVIAPDAGAAKRAFDVAQLLGVPFYQAEKHRDVTTGKLTGFNAPMTLSNGGRYLLVDDICDGGGTFNGLARAIYDTYEEDNITLDLWVTHGVFSQGTDKLLENFNQILTTDSTTFDKGNATVFPVIERLIRWI